MMKQKLFLTIALLLGILAPHSVLGYSFYTTAPTGQRLGYNTINAIEVAVSASSSSSISGNLVIPSAVTYNGITYYVTSIGHGAFRDCTGLTSVTIPNSVTSIGMFAFQGCTGLTTINYNAGGCSGDGFSYNYNWLDNCNALTTVIIGNQVASIPAYAFYCRTGLTSITIPNSVTSIGNNAFNGCSGLTTLNFNADSCTSVSSNWLNGCTSLTTLNIGNNVRIIPNYFAYNCSGLTSVTIPNSVTRIGYSAFQGCTGLTSVTIPNSVTGIGNYAFYHCTGLTSVTIPNSVTSIGDYAFTGCTGLTSIIVENGNSVYDSRNNCNAIIETATNTLLNGCNNTIIPNSVDSIGIYAFYGCTGLTSVTIPESVTSIGGGAFYGCTGLTSITIPNSVTSIGGDAFYGCSGLTSVTIGNSVTSIGGIAFYGCTGLTSVTIPNSVTSIGKSAFKNCTGLTTINYNAVNCSGDGFSYTDNWLANCYALTTVIIGNQVTSIPACAFYGRTRLTSVTIPNSVTSIGEGAFQYCTGLTSVTIPNSVTSIGNYAFYNCDGLTSVTIPNSVRSFGYMVFWDCTGLTSVTIGSSVTSIGFAAFYGCSGLTSVTIPNSVTSIVDSAFSYCTGLTSVTIGNSVTSIGYGAFAGCSGLTSVTIPNSVTSIGNGAFSGCSGLTTMNYNAVNCGGDGFTSGNNRWLFGCTALTSVNIGNSVARIPNYAFYNCTGLTGALTIPNSVTSIGDYAFCLCTGLTNVTIGNSVTSIGEAAFLNCTNLNTINYNATNCSGSGFTIANGSSSWLRGCSSLTRVNVGNNVRSIPEKAFYNCTSLHVLDLGSGLTSVGANAFYNCDHLDSIYSRSTTPPTVANTNAFENVWKGLPLTVPTGSRSAYAVAYAWRDFTNIVEMSAAQFTVTVNVNDASMGTVSGGGTYAQGATATLSATANTGYRFVQWNDGNTQNPRTVTVTADATYMAFFAANQYTVAVYTNDSTMGTVTGGGSYAYGTTATLNATPNTGYTFTRWQDGNTDNPRTVTVSADATYIAFFAADQYTVTVFTNDSTMGTVTGGGTYAQGATATLTATPNTGYTFTQWQDGNTDNPRTVTVTGNATYMAYFAADQSNAPQIAYVGVDSNGHNAVSWTPQAGTSPVRYNVYREGIQAGVYELVGVVNASGAASYSWTDDQSNPATRAYSYRLAEVAADNTESDLSIPHTTIHLQISQGQGDAWNLAWTPYVGFNYSTYNLYRGTDASSMTLLTTLPATATTYSDLNTGGTAYYYQIEVVQLSGAKTTAVSSRSNIVTTDPDPQTYTLTVLSADVLRGTVTGGGSYTEGTMATLTAEANEGYVFLQWQDGSTANPRNILVTANGTYMAYFTQTEGIADAEGSNVTIIARNGRIRVSGAEGRQVMLSDALGRILYRGTATEPLTVEAPATGIYLLQVDGHPAHRISVVR